MKKLKDSTASEEEESAAKQEREDLKEQIRLLKSMVDKISEEHTESPKPKKT